MSDGNRLFSKPQHVGCPNLGNRHRLLTRFTDILERRWLTNDGYYVRAFEEQLGDFLSVKHCVAVCNATLGLQLSIRALELQGEIIVPSFTFPATVHAIAWQGIRPVFCDVDPETHNIDPQHVERLITANTTAILGVHLWGNPCAVESLAEIARRHRLKLLFDAAHAFGSAHQGRMVGNFGDAEVFSFHATKFVTTGEGGAITTNSDPLAEELRRLRNFGMEAGQVAGLGINGKMSEFAAAMGLTSLESRDDFIAHNRRNLALYQRVLADVPGLKLLLPATPERRNFQYAVVAVDSQVFGMSRDQILASLHAENVLAKRYFFPGCHRLEPYRSQCRDRPFLLPQTDRLTACLLQLPTGTNVSGREIAMIGRFLQRLTSHARSAA